VGLWAEDAGVLLAGDVVYDSGELLDEMKGSSVPDYCATLRRLRELPVQTVYAGHGRPFGRDLLGRRIEEYLGKRA
jgi:glyoxylase-like metal-dependent hydrolase (beta-lactamase superfamily II)